MGRPVHEIADSGSQDCPEQGEHTMPTLHWTKRLRRKRATEFAVAGVLASTFLLAAAPAPAGEPIHVAGYGGVTWELITKNFLTPLEEKTGVVVKLETEPSLAKLSAMVGAGRCDFEVIELYGAEYEIAVRDNLLQDIDYSVVDPDNIMPDFTKHDKGFLFVTFSELLVYRRDHFPDGGPQNMADLWDAEKFPGPRTLHDTVVANLEFALLADGVALGDLYDVLSSDEGVDRAFMKLDEIKPHVVKFWSAGAEPVQLLADGEAHLGIAWNGRIKKLQDSGVDVVMVWNGANTDSSRYGIPRGCENKKDAEIYLSAWANPEWVANWSRDIPYPGFVPGVMDRLDSDYAMQMPTHPDNAARSFLTDWSFWEKNRESLEERWKEWLLE